MRNRFILLAFGFFGCVFIFQACQSEQDLNYARYYTSGQQVYQQHCKNCHGDDGQGLVKLYPPLTDTTYLKNNRNKLVCFIKYGMNDTITINGVEFSEKMPAESHLANIDIAAVVTYITNSFGNKQGIYDVKDAEADLKACDIENDNK